MSWGHALVWKLRVGWAVKLEVPAMVAQCSHTLAALRAEVRFLPMLMLVERMLAMVVGICVDGAGLAAGCKPDRERLRSPWDSETRPKT